MIPERPLAWRRIVRQVWFRTSRQTVMLKLDLKNLAALETYPTFIGREVMRMKTRTLMIGFVVGAVLSFWALPTCAQSSRLIQGLDVNGDGKVSLDELEAGSAKRRMFDGLVEKYKLDPKKTYTVKELEEASGMSTSGSSGSSSGSPRNGDSRPGSPGSPAGSSRNGDPRRGPSRGTSGTSTRSSRPPSDGRPYRALEDLPQSYRPYDKDGDGQIGLYEWPKDRIREFLSLDKNDDGFLTINELRKPSSSNGEKDRVKEKEKEPETKPDSSDGNDL